MSTKVEENSLKRFDQIHKIFEKCILFVNFGYRGEHLHFFNFFFPVLFIVSTAFNVYHVFLTYDNPNRIQATYTIIFVAVHIQAVGKALMQVINYNDIKEIFLELRKFYTEKPHPMVRELRQLHNSSHIHGINIGIISYSLSFWFSEIFLQTFIHRLGGIKFPMQYILPLIPEDHPYFYIINSFIQTFLFITTLGAICISDCMVIMIAFQFRSELVCLAEVIIKLDDIEFYHDNKDILLEIYKMHLNMLKLFQVLSDIFFFMSFSQVSSSFHGICFLFYAVFVHGIDLSTFIIIFARPYTIKAAGMIDVSIYTFVEVLKLAGSYCAIFYALTNKN
ncbi:hypothetical protein DMENIID0001_083900 [Sergentomyia squamirostris]